MDESRLITVLSLLSADIAQLKATTEIILKTQAHFLAKVAGTDWKPILDDLHNQVREATTRYEKQMLEEAKLHELKRQQQN